MHKLSFLTVFLVFNSHFLFSQTDSSLISGSAKQKEGKHELAVLDFTEGIKKHDTVVQVFLKKRDEYEKISAFDRAEKGLVAPPIDTAFARSYYLRGVSYAAMKKNDEALNDLTTAIKINPGSGRMYVERGKLLWSAGQKYEGCLDLRMARSLGDSLAKELFDDKFCWNEAVLFYKDALSKLNLNQYNMALELIQKSIQLCPDSAAYFVVRGKCYSGMGKPDLAFSDFDKAIAAAPNNKDAYFGRGMAFYTQRKYQEAFDDLNKAIHLNEWFADAYLYRAYACEGMNKNESALYDYQQVQRMKPKDDIAYYKSGLLRNQMSDMSGACKDFKKAASLGNAEAAGYVKDCK